jgi:hypothetical protein
LISKSSSKFFSGGRICSYAVFFCRRGLAQEIAAFKGKLTPHQSADIQEKRNSLAHRIQQWREVQFAYTPTVATLLVSDLTNSDIPSPSFERPESTNLFLPSSLPSKLTNNPTIKRIAAKELRLRIAQADDALADIRRLRRLVTGLTNFKKLNVSGTGNKPTTRMRTLHNRMMNKVDRTANRYVAARRALLSLDPTGGNWKDRLRELDKAKDIRGPGRDPDDLTSKGRYKISWIRTVPRPLNTSPDDSESEETLNASLRSEWTKAKARRDRWDEEWQLVQEEMRRVVAYLEWRASWWRQQGRRRKASKDTDEGTMLGHRAYAEKQAASLLALARHSASLWIPALAKEDIVPDWAKRYNGAEKSQADASLTSQMDVDKVADDEDPENPDDTEDLDSEDDLGSVGSSPENDFDSYDLGL